MPDRMPDRPALSLDQGAIDVWLAHYADLVDGALLARMRELLSEDERRQQARFHFADDRQRHLVTRALVRTVLSHYVALAPADWRFGENAYGCPHITNGPALAAGLSFNVSHTEGLIALAVRRGRELGVDVENLGTREVSLGVAHQFFSPREVAELATVAQARRQDRFFEYWTFKEAYIKARGMGLSLPLDKFSFSFPSARTVRLAIEPELGDDADRWHFWQYRPGAGYLMALCAERRPHDTGAVPPAVTLRRAVPTLGHEMLDYQPLKSTAPP